MGLMAEGKTPCTTAKSWSWKGRQWHELLESQKSRGIQPEAPNFYEKTKNLQGGWEDPETVSRCAIKE